MRVPLDPRILSTAPTGVRITTGLVVDEGHQQREVQPISRIDRLPFSAFPEHARIKLQEFDENNDGR